MRRHVLALVALVALAPLASLGAQAERSRTYELRGGQWYTGSGFESRRLFVVDGRFTDRRPATVDSVIELGDRWIVPPFADAHTHLLTDPATAQRESDRLLAQGIFSVLSMTGSASGRRAAAGSVNTSTSVDVAYADALTSTRGHPTLSAEVTANRIPWDSLRQYWPKLLHSRLAEGDVYHTIDAAGDIERKWPRLRANAPDLVKIYLFDSERFAELSRDTTTIGARGLDPALVPAIVARAHRDGLRVAAHVETAADFRIAVHAGADIIAHLPGLSPRVEEGASRYRITDAAAAEARRRGTVVVPTAWLAERLATAKPWLTGAASERDTAQLRRAQEIQRASLAALRRAGVPIAIGSDLFESAVTEALYLHRLGAADARAVLAMLTEVTPRLVFPNRPVGRLRAGDEASFVALGCDPLRNLECIRSVSVRVKRGVVHPPPR
jgi:imidazolonepropionase-like amidohydrolase